MFPLILLYILVMSYINNSTHIFNFLLSLILEDLEILLDNNNILRFNGNI